MNFLSIALSTNSLIVSDTIIRQIYSLVLSCNCVIASLSASQPWKEKIPIFRVARRLHMRTMMFPTGCERSALSLRWPLTAALGSAPSLHKHGSSMASNSSGGGSSDRQRIAQQRLRIIAGHLQRSEDGDSTILAAECKAQGSKTDVSGEGKTVPRRRYKAVMERWTGVQPLWL